MKRLYLICLLGFLTCSFLPTILGKIPSFDDDDKEDLLISKKSSTKPEECDSKIGTCPEKSGKIKSIPKSSSGKSSVDPTLDKIAETVTKYVKDFMEGKLDLKKLLASEYVSKLFKMFMMAKLPGGNAALAGGLDVFSKFMSQAVNLDKKIRKEGLDLMQGYDYIQSTFSEIVPALIIAIQHTEKACQMSSLCNSARLARQSKNDLSKSVNMLLSNAVGSILDLVGKKKKGDHMKVVECCSSNDEPIYQKCSEKYLSEQACPTDRLNDVSLLKPIDLKQLEQILPKL